MFSNTSRNCVLLALHALTFAWGVITAAIGINALIKSNHDKDRVRHAVPPSATVNIDIKDVFDSGVVLSVVAALIALTSLLSLIILVFRRNATSSGRILRFLSYFLAFCTVWLFATLIPYDHFYATGSAKVSATIDGIAVPQTIIQTVEKATGVTAVYKHIHYVRNLAIIGWIAFLFAGITSVVSLLSAHRADDHSRHDDEKHAV